MATPPTRVAGAATVYNTTATPKTSGSLTVAVGDLLVVMAGAEGNPASIAANPTASGGSITWTLAQSDAVANFGDFKLWTGVVGAAGSITVSVVCSGGLKWGFSVTQWRGSDGVGASAKSSGTTGAPSLSLTTTVDNSAVESVSTDWNAQTGTITWRSVNGSAMTAESTAQVGGAFGYYAGYRVDAGTAGAKTLGTSAPTGQKWRIGGVEILGANAWSGTPEDLYSTGSGSSSLSLDAFTGSASLASSGGGSSASSQLHGYQASLAATGSGTATRSFTVAHSKSLAANGSGSSSLSYQFGTSRTVGASGSGSSQTVLGTSTNSQTVGSTGSGTSSRTVDSHTNSQGVASTGSGTSTRTVVPAHALTLSATGAGSSNPSLVHTASASVAATGSGTSTLQVETSGGQTLGSTGSGSSSVTVTGTSASASLDSSGTGSSSRTLVHSQVLGAAATGAGSSTAGVTGSGSAASVASSGSGTATKTVVGHSQEVVLGASGTGSSSLSFASEESRDVAASGSGSSSLQATPNHSAEVGSSGSGSSEVSFSAFVVLTLDASGSGTSEVAFVASQAVLLESSSEGLSELRDYLAYRDVTVTAELLPRRFQTAVLERAFHVKQAPARFQVDPVERNQSAALLPRKWDEVKLRVD